MNKKAEGGSKSNFNVGFVLALILLIVFATFFIGGAGKTIEIIALLYKIPAWGWVIFGVIMLVLWIKS